MTESIFLPKPVHGSIPIWVGGNIRTAVRRTTRWGDGWHPFGLGLVDFTARVQMIRESGRSIMVSLRMAVDLRKKRDDAVGASGERRAVLSGNREEILTKLEKYRKQGLTISALRYCIRTLKTSGLTSGDFHQREWRPINRPQGEHSSVTY